MSALALAILLRERLGLESIIHCTTRDRNLMALQAELLGAHALGVRNVLALTGDPPSVGNYPNATGVWDVDSIGLIGILTRLNQGVDWAGSSIGRAAAFSIGCALNPTAEDPQHELERFRRKLEAGAHFAMSQPIYALDQLLRFLDLSGPLPVPLLLGVMPLQSYKHAEFLHNELPGVSIPEDVRERMRRAGEHGLEEGAAHARELLEAARPHVQGVYIMPSFHRYELAAELVRGLRQTAAAVVRPAVRG
jgi:5,10-methylenetetrahydrofolate reductase